MGASNYSPGLLCSEGCGLGTDACTDTLWTHYGQLEVDEATAVVTA